MACLDTYLNGRYYKSHINHISCINYNNLIMYIDYSWKIQIVGIVGSVGID